MRVERADAAQGQHDDRRPRRAIQLPGNAPADCDALVRGRAHQRDRVVVFVQRPGAKALGHGLDGAEVHHVERADRHDLRNPRPSCRPESIRPGAEHATYDLVAPLGGRHVHDAGDIAVVDQPLHGATASARRVEDEHVEPGALQALAHGGHGRCGHTEHRGGEEGSIACCGFGRVPTALGNHARNRARRVAEDSARQRIQARDVDD